MFPPPASPVPRHQALDQRGAGAGNRGPGESWAALVRQEHRMAGALCFSGGGYPLVNLQKTMERSTIFNGKTHYKCQFSIAMLVYQRVDGMGWMANVERSIG